MSKSHKYDVKLEARCVIDKRTYDTATATHVAAAREGTPQSLAISNLFRTPEGEFFSVTREGRTKEHPAGAGLSMRVEALSDEQARQWCKDWTEGLSPAEAAKEALDPAIWCELNGLPAKLVRTRKDLLTA
jgi:hypothetical protein